MKIYMDNGATAFPKPPEVAKAMANYLENVGASVNRGIYDASQQVAEVVFETRELLCQLCNHPDPSHVVFTPGNTYGLNQLLFGILEPGDHCLVTALEHNAVVRPLTQLAKIGVTYTVIPCDQAGYVDPHDFEKFMEPATKMVLVSHGSNVCGSVQNVAEIGKICRKHGVFFCLDGAQTIGHWPIDFEKIGLDGLSIPGHKGLMGPNGIGALLLSDRLAKAMKPLVFGGTGSQSHLAEMPDYMPDKFEPGTPNIVGIYGLNQAVSLVLSLGIEKIQAHDQTLTSLFLDGLKGLKPIQILGSHGEKPNVPVISLDFLGRDNGEVARQLAEDFGIATRSGLHCAPWAHQALGSYPQGTVRFSMGHYTTAEEVAETTAAIVKIINS